MSPGFPKGFPLDGALRRDRQETSAPYDTMENIPAVMLARKLGMQVEGGHEDTVSLAILAPEWNGEGRELAGQSRGRWVLYSQVVCCMSASDPSEKGDHDAR